ncbi:MAG: hypothetical protein E3K37_14785 [Candidatus Kuenenia sp.]|nr:hypothetical protein [Candidatus Kuenenia hertensis]
MLEKLCDNTRGAKYDGQEDIFEVVCMKNNIIAGKICVSKRWILSYVQNKVVCTKYATVGAMRIVAGSSRMIIAMRQGNGIIFIAMG